MNWNRIWTGVLVASVLLCLSDLLIGVAWALGAIPGNLIRGFFCAWLYAVMRPRFGPGPKTAFVVGTSIFLIGLSFTLYSVGAIFFNTMMWVKLVAASYLAGWQYIEKAPS